MLLSSPRCILNCQQLKIHLPPLPESRDSGPKGQYLVSSPMSASPLNTRFSNVPQQHSTYSGKQSDSSKSGRSHSGKHSPAGSLSTPSTKGRHHDPTESLATTTSASVRTSQSSRTSIQSSNSIPALRDDPNDDCQDSPEGQSFTAGAPGVARRQKAHVPSACVNCKRKHLACETKRPCNRCLQTGKEVCSVYLLVWGLGINDQQASCVDVQHKKRGRPRLREEDNLREAAFGREYVHAEDYSGRNGVITVPQPGRPRSKSYRELRSQPEAPFNNHDRRPKTSDPGFGAGHPVQGQPTSTAPLFLSDTIPTVFLTPDLVVAQHNHAFAQALSLPFNASGHALTELIAPSEREKIFRLQGVLRAELRDVARLPPIHGRYDRQAPIPAIEALDIARATAGFQTRSEYWTFRLPKEQSRGFPISISLAQAGTHFIVLTLIQRPDSSKSILSPNISHTVRGHQMPSPLSPSSHSPTFERHLSKQGHTNGAQSRYYSNPSYTEHLPAVSPTYNTLDLQPSHSLSVGQYSQRSPPRSVELPYAGSRQSSSPEQLRKPRSNQDDVADIPRHLQLPPIRTSGSGINDTQREDRGRSGNGSPVKGSPQSGRKKKRRRVGIEEMLH